MKELVKRIPFVGPILSRAYWALHGARNASQCFPGSAAYWEQRYAEGGNSGAGSYALFADFKAEVLNRFVEQQRVLTVVEFGCGDGNQLLLAKYPSYLGVDVSDTAIAICREKFTIDPTKSFLVTREYAGQTADLSLSLDVIYHLVEDLVFESYMTTLFNASNRHVIIYASDTDNNTGFASHVKHRRFNAWISANIPNWKLTAHIPNKYPYSEDDQSGSFADFFCYEKS
jgi:SAM-dependent methyltransferase